MEEELYRKFYEVETEHWWWTARKKIIFDIIRQRLGNSHVERAIDVGCGTGAFLSDLSKTYETYGTDTSELAIEFCRKRGIANVFCCTLENFPRQELRFDLITLLDVIEHIEDDIAALRQCHHLMNPGAHILVTVPAYQFLWSHHDDVNHHKRRYTKSRLRMALKTSGFSIELLSYYNTLLFPSALVERLASKAMVKNTDSALDVPSPIVNSCLQSIFSLERFLLRKITLPFGLSVIALARKFEK
jgi:2-polyprenyl-3-methyl-5-hydroxy-6-metoxy-1,4-benzoquinol methylase